MTESTDLKTKVRHRAERASNSAGNGSNGGAVAGRPAGSVEEFIARMKGEIQRALPKHLTADRLARICLTEVRRIPDLARCTPESFGGAIMTCAQLGLEPGVTGEAYLLPFRNRRKNIHEVQLIIGYQGMIKLFWQSPLARSLDAQTVFEHDQFDYAYGLEPVLIHRPKLGDRGKPIAYYAVATLSHGGSAFVVMSPEDIEKIRTRSRAKDDGPWATDYDAMAKKTAIRQLFKLLPKSAELAQAIAQDESVRTDLSPDALDVIPAYVEPDNSDPDSETLAATEVANADPPARNADGAESSPTEPCECGGDHFVDECPNRSEGGAE